ncbi:restriction endonuclease subunit S [Glaciecola punicea]|uniref:restriction endonuclease subunit S n=1 Tax=Glaciecola punicea TaxID=56804 RepID=UPI000871C080|nr:restriction endonuclease subunit S [Glaciecola punicea]OFA33283.1 restriction endonuclease subunit S [Glaciecola punicea]
MTGKAVSNVKYTAYPEYRGSGTEWLVGIPQSWSLIRHKYVASFQKGKNPEVLLVEYEEGAVKYLSMDYLRGKANASYALPNRNSYISKQDQVLIIWDGSNAGEFVNGQEGIVSSTMAASEYLTNINHRFYWYLCVCIEPEMRKHSNGMGIPHVNGNELKNSALVIPSDEEQQQIAQFLDHETAKIDTLIDKQQQLIKLLKEKRQAVISHAVTKGLNPDAPMRDSGVEWLGEVPEHWTVKNYRYATQIYRGKFGHRPRNDPAFYEGEYPFIQTGDIARADKDILRFKQTLNERGISVSQKFPAGTLVMAIAANIGDTAILSFEAYAPDSVVGFKPNHDVSLEFLRYSLIGALQALEQTSTQSTQANLNIDRIGTVQASFPPLKEQHKTVEMLDKLHKQYAQIEIKALAAIGLMIERRTALISAAVTGKIDVRNWVAPELSNTNKEVA